VLLVILIALSFLFNKIVVLIFVLIKPVLKNKFYFINIAVFFISVKVLVSFNKAR